MSTPRGLIKWGAKPILVKAEVATALESLRKDHPIWHSILWRSATQGYGFASASAGTHAGGWCVDFSLRPGRGWTERNAAGICRVLEGAGFAVAPRAAGELGPGNPAHVHVALRGKANSAAILAAQRQGRDLAARLEAALESLV